MYWMYGVGPPCCAGSGPKRGPPRNGPRRGSGSSPPRTSSWETQGAVDLAAQLVAHGEVGDERGERDGDGDGHRDRDGHPAAQRQRAHQSRST